MALKFKEGDFIRYNAPYETWYGFVNYYLRNEKKYKIAVCKRLDFNVWSHLNKSGKSLVKIEPNDTEVMSYITTWKNKTLKYILADAELYYKEKRHGLQDNFKNILTDLGRSCIGHFLTHDTFPSYDQLTETDIYRLNNMQFNWTCLCPSLKWLR